MKRKMLISIALITIMLLNCMMPLFSVYAAEGEEIQLNSNLYRAVKEQLSKQGLVFTYDDKTHKISLDATEIAKVTTLNLNNSGIYDLTGLDVFTNLTKLDLSANDLYSEDLAILNSFPSLNDLDLSSNRIDDVSSISGIVERLHYNGEGTLILSGQTVDRVCKVGIDTSEDKLVPMTATFEVPQILSLAGKLKSNWKTRTAYTQEEMPKALESSKTANEKRKDNLIEQLPYIDTEKFGEIFEVGEGSNTVTVTVASEDGVPYYGMLKYTIHIYDDPTEDAAASNLNRASENILKDSKFNMYVVVYNEVSEAIRIEDTNLYKAIKEQLTAGQDVNPNLPSCSYVIDSEGNKIYEEFVYEVRTINNEEYQVLIEKESNETRYARNTKTQVVYEYNGTTLGDEVKNKVFEPINVEIVDETNGKVETRKGYKSLFQSDDTGVTLYYAAYDDAKTFVIQDYTLINKITSLILDGRQIRDLSGIEYFVGLSSDLDVSNNYLNNIKPLSLLQEQKNSWEEQLRNNYKDRLLTRPYGNLKSQVATANTAMDNVNSTIESVNAKNAEIFKLLKEAAQLTGGDATDEAVKKQYEDALKQKADAIAALLKEIYGYINEEGKEVPGIVDNLDDYLNNEEGTGINDAIYDIYTSLSVLYTYYNDEYKITTLLADKVNYMTHSEYDAYQDIITGSNYEELKALVTEQISHLKKLESANALTELDKIMFSKVFGIDFNDEEDKTPLSTYFDKLLNDGNAQYGTYYRTLLKQLRLIGIYSEMANYCLIKRMEFATADGYCYAEEYLEKRIKELDVEDIPTDIEDAILATLRGEAATVENSISLTFEKLVEAFDEYSALNYDYGQKVYLASGEYSEVDWIDYGEDSYYTPEEIEEAAMGSAVGNYAQAETAFDMAKKEISDQDIEMVKEINVYEYVNFTQGTANELVIYDQLMALANRLLNGNVDRYIQISDLKKLNISSNKELSDLDGITVLTSLSDLNASDCAVEGVEEIDWSLLTNLRKLSLANNNITTMDPFVKLENLTYLDLSKNLISGKVNISEADFKTLFDELEVLNLAENAITDITDIQFYLDFVTDGNYANYFAETDEFELNLQKQKIEIVVEEPIELDSSVKTVRIELPKLFTQLKAIDAKRTAFGINSRNGSIESEGTYAILNVTEVGKQEAIVTVENKDSNAAVEDYCVGNGTYAIITYTVVDEVVETPDEGEEGTNPDEGNTNPDGGTTNPDEGNTNPDGGTTNPDEGNTNPDEGTTNPDEGNTNPDGGTTNPDGGNTNPDEGNTTVDTVNPDELGYEAGEEFLTGVSPKTPVEDFKTIFLNGEEYNVVIKKDGETITSGNMATGMYVQLQDENGEVVKDQNGDLIVYEVIVNGDVNGDGLANSQDSLLIKAYRNEITTLSGSAFEAADINDDGRVNITDSKLLLYHRAEVKGYNLNFTK